MYIAQHAHQQMQQQALSAVDSWIQTKKDEIAKCTHKQQIWQGRFLHTYIHKLTVLSPAEKSKPMTYGGILQTWDFLWTEILNLCSKNAIGMMKFNILLMNVVVEVSSSFNSFPATKRKIKSQTGTASGLHWQVNRWMITLEVWVWEFICSTSICLSALLSSS